MNERVKRNFRRFKKRDEKSRGNRVVSFRVVRENSRILGRFVKPIENRFREDSL